MLKIINPKDQKLHQTSVESYQGLLKTYQNFELSPQQKRKSTFLIADDERYGVYAGAILYPGNICDSTDSLKGDTIDERFNDLFKAFQPQVSKCWRARICFCLEASSSFDGQMKIALSQAFYRTIYETLVGYCHEHNIEFLSFTSFSLDTLKPPLHKVWPHCMPLEFSHTTGRLSHGILSLNGRKFLPKTPKNSKIEALRGANKNGSEIDSQGRVA